LSWDKLSEPVFASNPRGCRSGNLPLLVERWLKISPSHTEEGVPMSTETIELQNLDAILAQHRAERASDWLEADFFTFFVSEQLLKNTGASVEEVVDSIVDGGNDCGVDSITYLINESPAGRYPDLHSLPSEIRMQIIIVQSKSGLSFEERPLLEMATRLPQLFDSTRDEDDVALWCNPALQEQTKRFLDSLPLLLPKFPHVSVKIYYASRSTNPPHPKVVSQADALREALTRNPLFAAADVEFLQARDILGFARQQLRTTFRIRCVTQPMTSPDGSGYVGFVSLPAFKNFVSTEGGDLNTQLFESNVRDHEGRTEVNVAIQTSLNAIESADDFWWLNNGVTILASRTMANGHELELESPPVVNGLQTSTEIWLSPIAPTDSRLLLIRVIKTVDSSARDRIIQATNYQTAIPTSALRATDPIQRDIEDWFLQIGLFYDRRRNYYFNRSHPISDIVSMPRLAEAIASCFLQEPNRARTGGNGLMSDDATYDRMFASRNANFLPELFEAIRTIEKSRDQPTAHRYPVCR
jgi:hypothetical protein